MADSTAGRQPEQPKTIPCMLPYPDRYHAADTFVKLQLPGTKEFSQETQLALYSLNKQIHEGPVNVPKPWSWNAVESAKWMAWAQLGKMSAVEAMRLYVRTVEEEQPDWYARLLAEEAKPQHQAAGASPIPAHAYAQEDTWITLPLGEQRKPCPRYEHSSGLVGGKLYVVGGNYAGRYLNDMWSFDTLTLTWQQVVPVPATRVPKVPTPPPSSAGINGTTPEAQLPFPVQPTVVPLAGHTVTVWGDKLVIVGGHVKSRDAHNPLPVRIYHTECNAWELVSPSGDSPSPRGAHSANLVGQKLYIFGGEDASRRALGDLHVLDLPTMTWERTVNLAVGRPVKKEEVHYIKVEGKPPSPHAAHSAVVYQDRYIVFFGGGSVATCYSDVHILDTRSEGGRLRWVQANVQGPKVSPRAGHSGALVGSTWYILGGGNNVNGCTDLLALDLRTLDPAPVVLYPEPTVYLWQLGSFPLRHPLSSEGVSLIGIRNIGNQQPPYNVPDPAMGMLLAFGGYNGKYQNAVNVLRVPAELPSSPPPSGPPPSGASPTPASLNTIAANGVQSNGQASQAGAQPKQEPSKPSPPPPSTAAPPQPTPASTPPAPTQSTTSPATANQSPKAPTSAPVSAAAAAAAARGGSGAGAQAGGAVSAGGAPGQSTPPQLASERQQLAMEQQKLADKEAKLVAKEQILVATEQRLSATEQRLSATEQEKQALRKQLQTTMAQLETAQKGLDDARGALSRESAKVLRLEAEAAENHKKLAMAGEEHKELLSLRRQVSEASAKPSGVRAYLGF